MSREKKPMPVIVRILLIPVGILQVAFALLAFLDLASRTDAEVTLKKPAWIPIILVNWVGPAAYFLFGIRR